MVWEGARADLPEEVKPGGVVSVMVPVSAVSAEGERLLPSGPEDLWHYRIQWDLVAGEDEWFSKEGAAAGEEAVQLASREDGVSFQSVASTAELEPGERTSVDVVIANGGSRVWRAGEDFLAYRWYRWDGRPAEAAALSGLPVDVGPGERVLVTAGVTAPGLPGPYWLAWGLAADEGAAEAQAANPQCDLAVSPAFVRPTNVRPIDLSAYANVRAIASDSYRARGDFDGRGASLPAEWLPPDQSGPKEHLYPDGYYAPGRPRTDIPFAFPAMSSGVAGAVACSGQTIPLGEKGAVQIHMAIASSEGPRATTFRLADAAGEVHPVTVPVPPWDQWTEGAAITAYCPYLRTLSGDDTGRQAYLYHLTLSPPSGTAVSLELPREPWIKILAMTVEQP